MKLQIVSDIHIDHWMRRTGWGGPRVLKDLVPDTDADFVVIAGDLGTREIRADDIVRALWRRELSVIWLEGNHDFYGGHIHHHHEESLARSRISIGRQWFTGATLWHDDTPEARARMHQLSDFTQIAMWAETVCHHNAIDKAWIRHALEPGDVLVTHHLPLPESIAPKYAGDPLNCLFLSDISDIIRERHPKLVVHGHTHEKLDYMFGPTRVVCNPIGYPGENWEHGTRRWPPEPMVVEV